ncbi:MAG: MFS transporter [Fibrobacteria bacterium]|nr:MFS transporter [Fibrobacteria bacterium]
MLGGLALFLSFGAWVNIQYNSYLFEARGLAPAQIGFVNALGSLAALFSPLLAGWWADRSGRPILVLGLYFSIAATLIATLPHLTGFVALSAGYFLMQVAVLPIAPLSQSIVLLRSSRSQGDFLALRAMGTLGFFLTTLVLASTLTAERLPVAYACMGAFLVVSIPAYRALPEPSRPRRSIHLPLREVVSCLWKPGLRVVYWGGGFAFLASSMAGSVLGNLVTGPLGGEPRDISRAWALATGFEIALIFAAIPFLRRFGVRALVLGGILSMVVRWAAAGLAPNYGVFLGTQVLHGLMVAGLFTGQNLFLARLLPPERVASGAALASALNGGVMSTLGTFLAGWIWQVWDLRTVYLVAAVISLLAFFFFLRFAPHPRGEETVDAIPDAVVETEPQ